MLIVSESIEQRRQRYGRCKIIYVVCQ